MNCGYFIGYGIKAIFDLFLSVQILTAPQLTIGKGVGEAEEKLLNVGLLEITHAIKALKPGQDKYVILEDERNHKFIQTLVEFIDKGEAFYLVEYREGNEKPLYEFIKRKNQADTLRTFIKFLHNDPSFKNNARVTVISQHYIDALPYLKPPKDINKAISHLKLAAEEGYFKALT